MSAFHRTAWSTRLCLSVALVAVLTILPARALGSSSAEPHQPVDRGECKNGGWQDFPNIGFRNQGDCIRFVETGVFECRDALGCLTYGPDEPVRLASALAISGGAEFLGVDSQHGVELALSQQGTLLGHSLELRPEDDMCSEEGGASAANAILSDPTIAAVVGTTCSSAAYVAAPLLSEAGLSMVSPSNTSSGLTDPDTHEAGYLRTSVDDADGGAFMAQFVWDQGVATSAVILDGSSELSVLLGESFTGAFEGLGGIVLATYDASVSDLDSVLDELASNPPGVLYLPGTDSGLAFSEVSGSRSRAGLNDTILAANEALHTQEFVDSLGGQADGMLFALTDDSFTARQAYLDFFEAFSAYFGFEPLPFYGAYAFDATRLVLAALENTGVVDGQGNLHFGRQALRDALFATEGLEGTTGTITCDDFGDCAATGFRVLQVEPRLEGLIRRAQEEGSLTVIALPRDWCNYGAIIDGFTERYGIPVVSVLPEGSSADELEAIRAAMAGPGPDSPDVIDVGPSFALQAQAEGLITPYQVSNWNTIPSNMKDDDGFWYGDYYGVMAIAANITDFPAPLSWEDLRSGANMGSVALGGVPTESNLAFFSVYSAALANGGSLDDIEPGLSFFRDLKEAGRLLPDIGNGDTLVSGQTPILVEWTYLALAQRDANPEVPIEVLVPHPGAIAGFYTQAVSAYAPHPNAARLWMEYLYSDEGQLAWLEGYCFPALFDDLLARGVIPDELLARLPDPSGAEFPTVDQIIGAQEFLQANWECTVYGCP